ncbi:MAG: RNA polymerase sigma factor [Candidatus Kerfeldbacteria bacterium]|nr:RNA polymerase sigma factor [Candidatus Kerfeldbacteria bacterium]
MDELAIITACQCGQPERFAALYDAYVDRIYAFHYYRLGHQQTAEDLTSTTFLKALESITTFHTGSFSAWLYRIARNTLIDFYRTRRPTLEFNEQFDRPAPHHPDQSVDATLAIERIQRFLRTLTDDHRELVLMRLWDQLPFAEIAAITGRSEASCKMAFSRTMAKLRAALGSIRPVAAG